MSGFMSLTGEPDGGPQNGLPVADLMAGMYAAVAITPPCCTRKKPVSANISISAC